MADRLISGIDIGSSKIATILALQSAENDELRIIGFNSTPSSGVKKGLIVDIDKVTNSVEKSIEKAERMAGRKISSAFILVGGPHIASLNSHGVVAISHPQGEIIQDDIDRVVEAARAVSLSSTRQIIEVIPRDYIVDGQEGIKNPIGMSGVRLEVETHIITASQTNLKNIERCLLDLGINNEGFVFSGQAAAEAVLTETEKELGVTVVDIGGGKTDISLYVDGSLSHSCSIPVGARHVTNDIAVGLRISLDSAEQIKLFLTKNKEMPGGKNSKKEEKIDIKSLRLPDITEEVMFKTLVDDILAPRLEELCRFIGEEIEKSGFATTVPSGLVLTGGGALTLGLLETAKRVVRLPVRLGLPTGVTGLVDEVIDPQFSGTVGLILYGKKNIMGENTSMKNFDKIFRDFSMGGTVGKLKDFFKQFIP